jgi:serine/threonine-protein kinase
MGSPLYMSPEQMQTPKDVDGQTDIWALGVILYELVSGQVPFGGDTFAEVAIKAATQPPPPLTSWRPDVPPALQAVVFRCLSKTKNERYRNVAELATALAPYAPAHARGSIDRISRIVQGVGSGSIDVAARTETTGAASNRLPPSPVASTAHAIGRTSPGVTRGGGGVKAVAGIAAIVAVTVGVTLVVTRASSKPGAEPATHATLEAPSARVAVLAPPSAPVPSLGLAPVAPSVAAPVEPAPAASSPSLAPSRPPSAPPAGKKKPPAVPPPTAAARPDAPPPDSDPLSRLRFKQ